MTDEFQPFSSTPTLQSFQSMFSPLGYAVKEIIAANKNTVLLKAEQIQLQREVAIKILSIDQLRNQTSERRFEAEARLLGSFENDSIVQLYGTGRLPDRRSFMVMEFLKGKTLQELLQAGHKFTEEQIRVIGIQLCEALAYAHERKVIHRDLKPANVIVLNTTDSGKQFKVKLVDFGIFKSLEPVDQQLTQGELTPGTTNYMSVEQCKGEDLDERSDIYSLGCVLYELCTGVPPMHSDSDWVIMSNHLNKDRNELKFPAEIGNGLRRVVLKCLNKERQDRFFSMNELASELRKGESAHKYGGVWLIAGIATILIAISFPILSKSLSPIAVVKKGESGKSKSDGRLFKKKFQDFHTNVVQKEKSETNRQKLVKSWFQERVRDKYLNDDFFDALFGDQSYSFDSQLAKTAIALIDKQLANEGDSEVSPTRLYLAKAFLSLRAGDEAQCRSACIEATKLTNKDEPYQFIVQKLFSAFAECKSSESMVQPLSLEFRKTCRTDSDCGEFLTVLSIYYSNVGDKERELSALREAARCYLKSKDKITSFDRMVYLVARLNLLSEFQLTSRLAKKYHSAARGVVPLLIGFVHGCCKTGELKLAHEILDNEIDSSSIKGDALYHFKVTRLVLYSQVHESEKFRRQLKEVLSDIAVGNGHSIYFEALANFGFEDPVTADLITESLKKKNPLFVADLDERIGIRCRMEGQSERAAKVLEKALTYYDIARNDTRFSNSDFAGSYAVFHDVIEKHLLAGQKAEAREVLQRFQAQLLDRNDRERLEKYIALNYEGQLERLEGNFPKAIAAHKSIIEAMNTNEREQFDTYLAAEIQLLADYVYAGEKRSVVEWKKNILPKFEALDPREYSYRHSVENLLKQGEAL